MVLPTASRLYPASNQTNFYTVNYPEYICRPQRKQTNPTWTQVHRCLPIVELRGVGQHILKNNYK